MADDHRTNYLPGITVRSVAAAILCMLVAGMHVQIAEVLLNDSNAMGEQALAVPAMLVFVALTLIVGLLYLARRYRLLTRPELLCVVAALLISAPMMTQGMWHRIVGLLAAPSRSGSFEFLDAYSDKLWPHGPNLVLDEFSQAHQADLKVSGNPPAWQDTKYETGHQATLPVLTNTAPGQVSSITLTIPLHRDGKTYLAPGEPYLISFLAKPDNLAPEAFFFCRLHNDNGPKFTEVINSKEKAKITFLHQQGFLRDGVYGAVVGAEAKDSVQMEVGLSGVGTLAVYDPKLFSVAALEEIYTGRKLIRQSDYDKLPEAERAGLVVKPDNMISPRGLAFLLSGYIPLRPWLTPAFAWSALIFLVLMATLAINVIMRKQWAENERYPFPLFQIPYALIGHEDEDPHAAFPAIWKNRYMWIGFGVSLLWCLLKGWHFYNGNIPALDPKLDISQYITDPRWGATWQITFDVKAIIVSLAMFMELNVLLSMVVGFLGYRLLYWVGEFTNLKVYTDYPFRQQQAVGAYIGYAVVVLFFTRKYLAKVVKAAFSRRPDESGKTETFSYRVAMILLAACFCGAAVWAGWLGVSRWVILLYFAFLVLIGFVSAKFRAEAGLIFGYFTPYNAMLLLTLLGGMAVFGASGIMVALIASGFITVTEFFLIPGAQLELMEFGRRYKMNPRHVLYACLVGILGGLFIGGWVFLSNSYALGGDNIKYAWAYDQNWFYGAYRSQLSAATSNFLRASQGTHLPHAIDPSTWGYVLGAGVTIIVAVLRQLFAGFWFHPIGVVLSSSYYMSDTVWGSALVAWVIRSIVLRLGGAATVKNKLLPFFVGFFLAAVLSVLIWDIYAFHLQGLGIDRLYSAMP